MTATTTETPITMLLLLFQTTINNHHRYQAFSPYCRFLQRQWPAGNAPPRAPSSDRNPRCSTTGTPMPQRGRQPVCKGREKAAINNLAAIKMALDQPHTLAKIIIGSPVMPRALWVMNGPRRTLSLNGAGTSSISSFKSSSAIPA
jgi:hypothetical protein